MKKLLTLLFTFVVAFSLAMPVFAQETTTQETTKAEKKTKKTKATKTKKAKKTTTATTTSP
jgi:mannitol-specific phosphotransferase system IIBC component